MDLTQLMLSRIDLMLESVGPGMKVLLMDSDTTTSVSLSCPQSQVPNINTIKVDICLWPD